jgi:hypothetical protein
VGFVTAASGVVITGPESNGEASDFRLECVLDAVFEDLDFGVLRGVFGLGVLGVDEVEALSFAV